MTREEKIKTLNQYRWIKDEVEFLKNCKREAQEQKKELYEQDTGRLLEESYEAKRRILNWIGKLEDAEERTILQLRYIQGYKLNQIENIINYSYRHIRDVHNAAVDHLPDDDKTIEELTIIRGRS